MYGARSLAARRASSCAIRNPIDHACLVVRHEQRSVRHLEDVDRPPPFVPALQPSFGERLVFHWTVSLQTDQRNPIADWLRPIPRSMLGDEDLFAVLRRKHRAGVELQAESRHMRTERLRGRRVVGARMAAAELGGGSRACVTL